MQVVKEYVCHFGSYKTQNTYRSGQRPEVFSEPSTYHLDSPDPAAAGWVFCEDPAVIGNQASGDGIPGHWKQLRLPLLPANATNIQAECVWENIVAHIVNRTENLSLNDGGYYTIDHGPTQLSIAFMQFSGVSTGQSRASGFFKQDRGPETIGPQYLAVFDGNNDYLGDSAWESTLRVHNLGGTAPLNSSSFPSNGVTENTFRDGDPDYPENDYITICPVVSFGNPVRTWTGQSTPYTRDFIWGGGVFTLRFTYEVP